MHRAAAAATLPLLLLMVPLTGCLAQDAGGNQNMRAPKLVVASTPDGAATVYVHAAFTSERLYDRIRLDVGNTTVAEERYVYALQHKTNRSDVHLNVHVREDGAEFTYEARFRFLPDGDSVRVTPITREGPQPMQNATLPFTKIIPPLEEV